MQISVLTFSRFSRTRLSGTRYLENHVVFIRIVNTLSDAGR